MKVIMSFRCQEVNIIQLLYSNQAAYIALDAMTRDRLVLVISLENIRDKRPKKKLKDYKKKRKKKRLKNREKKRRKKRKELKQRMLKTSLQQLRTKKVKLPQLMVKTVMLRSTLNRIRQVIRQIKMKNPLINKKERKF